MSCTAKLIHHPHLHLFTHITNRKRKHTPPHIGTAMIIMMVMLPASVLVTVGVATKVTGTAAVVGVIEDAGKTPMSKMEYNCLTPVVIVVVGFGTSPII